MRAPLPPSDSQAPFYVPKVRNDETLGHRTSRTELGRLESASVAFLLTSLVIVALPGTGALITLSAGLSRARASVVAAFGCTLGILPHLIAAVTGTAALLRASGIAFDVLRIVGVAYLLLMAVLTWRDKSRLRVEDDQPPRPAGKVIASAILANALNPKLTVFFFAFLPQFVPPHAQHELQRLLLLSGTFMVMTFVVFVVYGVAAARCGGM